MKGSSRTSTAGRWARSVASAASDVRRRSESRPSPTRISCSALLPVWPLRYVEVRESNSSSGGLRCAAQSARPMAAARSTAARISSRYDVLPPDQLRCACAERRVAVGIAGDRREEVAVELRHEARQGRATPVGQTRFPDVPHVHQKRDQRDHDEGHADAEAERMLPRHPIEPVDQILPLARQPREEGPALDPLKLRACEHLADYAPNRVRID